MRSVPIAGPWTVSFDTTYGGPKKDVQWTTLKPWNEDSRDAIRFYSGIAHYTTTFRVPSGLSLDSGTVAAIEIGNVHEMARISVNGHSLDTLWTPPQRASVPANILQQGENSLTIEVANNWNNRLVGDNRSSMPRRWLSFDAGFLGGEPVKAGWYTFTTSEWYDSSNRRPLQQSGLTGPVRLVF